MFRALTGPPATDIQAISEATDGPNFEGMGEKLHDELAQARIVANGHAGEARVYAESPAKTFLPSPGLLIG